MIDTSSLDQPISTNVHSEEVEIHSYACISKEKSLKECKWVMYMMISVQLLEILEWDYGGNTLAMILTTRILWIKIYYIKLDVERM